MKTGHPAGPPSATESELTVEEALVLSRIDGQRTLSEIADMFGMPEERARAILEDLARRGAIDLTFDDEPPSRPALTAVDESDGEAYPDLGEPVADEEAFGGLIVEEVLGAPSRAPDERLDEGGEQAPEPSAADAAAEATDAAAEATDAAAEATDETDAAAEERNYRKTFESKFHGLAPDVRAGLASLATGGDLCALCLDPDPRVIAAVLANATFGLQHARLIAFHHRTGTGLEHVASRPDLVRDALVSRRLIRNPQLAAVTLRRILQSRRLLDIYKVAIDHDIPELSRSGSRGLLRTKFSSQAQPEERADLIVRTEARVLQLLSGCTFDARTTQILCGRQAYSALFIQNVARFGASPPLLLAHLAKLPFVRRNPGLKKVLMQHPNMPGDVKRSM